MTYTTSLEIIHDTIAKARTKASELERVCAAQLGGVVVARGLFVAI